MEQIQETINEGLRRVYEVTVPEAAMKTAFQRKLHELSAKVRVDGFRKGKAPASLVKQRYGDSVLQDLVTETVDNVTRRLLTERSLSPAFRPDVAVKSLFRDRDGGDLAFTVDLEIMPDIPDLDLSGVQAVKYVIETNEDAVTERLNALLERAGKFTRAEEGYGAKEGDRTVIDFTGFIDGVAFQGGEGKGFGLRLGSGNFIPGFEDQLIGATHGEERDVNVSFPDEYHAAELAGKPALFKVRVEEVQQFAPAVLNEEFLKRYQAEDEAALRAQIRDALARENELHVRPRMKQELFDALEKVCLFAVPNRMVDNEFRQIRETAKNSGEDPGDDVQKNTELRAIADRRVRLGLFLAYLGKKENVQVTSEELSSEFYRLCMELNIQPQRLSEYYKQNPDAVEGLRGRALEEKVVDHLFSTLTVVEKKMTREAFDALLAVEDEEEPTA